jgi:hypothetical protein
MKLSVLFQQFAIWFITMKELCFLTRAMAQLVGRLGAATEIDNPPGPEYA